jgi:hypothetical protein
MNLGAHFTKFRVMRNGHFHKMKRNKKKLSKKIKQNYILFALLYEVSLPALSARGTKH